MLKTQGIERSVGIKCSKEGREAGHGPAASWMTRLCRDALGGLGELWRDWKSHGDTGMLLELSQQ